jgi:hypothetical protein
MRALLTQLTAVERLAAHVTTLPGEFVRALGEDLEYARFGALLPELPWFGGWSLGVEAWVVEASPPPYATLLTRRAPVAFGLKAAELVSNGALVGSEAGLAFVAGWFSQLCVSRSLEPLVARLVEQRPRSSERPSAARSRIEWAQSLFLMQELHGSPLVGTPAVRAKLQIRKGSPLSGVGRGLYELMRVCSLEALGEAPRKPEVDGWMRGLSLFSLAVGSPLGRLKALPAVQLRDPALYRAPGIDVFAALDRGLDQTREVLRVVGGMIRRNSFSTRSRQRLLELLPEGPPEVTAPVLPSGGVAA